VGGTREKEKDTGRKEGGNLRTGSEGRNKEKLKILYIQNESKTSQFGGEPGQRPRFALLQSILTTFFIFLRRYG